MSLFCIDGERYCPANPRHRQVASVGEEEEEECIAEYQGALDRHFIYRDACFVYLDGCFVYLDGCVTYRDVCFIYLAT